VINICHLLCVVINRQLPETPNSAGNGLTLLQLTLSQFGHIEKAENVPLQAQNQVSSHFTPLLLPTSPLTLIIRGLLSSSHSG
jgi:hypothetical protein